MLLVIIGEANNDGAPFISVMIMLLVMIGMLLLRMLLLVRL